MHPTSLLPLFLFISANLISQEWYQPPLISVPEWGYKDRTVYTVDLQGNITDGIFSYWDLQTHSWKDVSRYNYRYDEAGNLVEESDYNWDDVPGCWIGTERGGHRVFGGGRISYSYDSLGNLLESAYYDWDTLTQGWIDPLRSNFIYNGRQQLIEFSGYVIGFFSPTRVRHTYKYDAPGRLIEECHGFWDNETNGFLLWDSCTISYDSLGNVRDSIGYVLDTENHTWNMDYSSLRYNLTYDSTGRIIGKIIYRWHNGWRLDEKYLITYNPEGTISELENYGFINDWKLNEVRLYDEEGRITEIIYYLSGDPSFRSTYTYEPEGNIRETYNFNWDKVTGTWVKEWGYRFETIVDSASRTKEYNEYDYDLEFDKWNKLHSFKQFFDEEGRPVAAERYGRQIGWEISDRAYWYPDIIWNQTIYVEENRIQDTLKYTPEITKEYDPDSITFKFAGNQPEPLFEIDNLTGEIDLIQPVRFDFETRSSYLLTIEARSNEKDRPFSDYANVTVSVRNVNDNPPVIQDTILYIYKHEVDDMDESLQVGTLHATDPDGDLNPLAYILMSGNESGIFRLDPASGELNAQKDSIEYEKQKTYTLVVEVSDGTFSDQATITVQVTNQVETRVAPSPVPDVVHNGVTLYPNPTSGIVTIDLPEDIGPGTVVEVKDPGGRVRLVRNLTDHKLDLSNLPGGVYIITIRSADFVTTGKILRMQ